MGVIDLTGKRFGQLEVIKLDHINKHRTAMWLCKCDCGNKKVINGNALRRGITKSCGHRKDITGQTFNDLTVIGFSHYDKSKKAYWKCKCSCGKETIVQGANLESGLVRSCGCAKKYSQLINLKGQRFGKITVIDFVGRKNNYSLWRCVCDCGKVLNINTSNLRTGHTQSCGCVRASKPEIEIKDYIQSLIPNIRITKSRVLDGFEIDIYLPDYNFGIEYNGSAFHASVNGAFGELDKNYHKNKFILAESKGIRLFSVFDVDWFDHPEKIKSIIQDILIPPYHIFARKCSIERVSYSEAAIFLEKYHLQGSNKHGNICYGLYNQGELISVMTFHNYGKYYEIKRYATKSGIVIIGGAKKLFSHFLRDYSPNKVLSYSDNNYFTGNIYKHLGFKFCGYTVPDYYWFLHDKKLSRESCQVHKLKKQYPQLYDDSAKNKEDDIMVKLGARKVYCCGNKRWEYVNKSR